MATITGSKRVLSASYDSMVINTSLTLGGFNVATESYVDTSISNLVASAPTTLDTLNELAAALGDDPNFATTVTNSIAGKLSLTGGTLSGTLLVPELRTNNAQQIVINAGESHAYATGQTGEYVYANAEAGLQVNTSPDNWNTGWAGRQTTTISGASIIINGNTAFHDGYHPNADKWTTARTHTVSLSGDVTGSASQSVDGTGNRTWSVSTSVANSVFHSRGNSPADLNNADMGVWRINASEANRPSSGVNYGTLISFDNSADTGFQIAASYSSNKELWFRGANASVYGGSGSFQAWERIFHTAYHPNADKWTTARTETINLTGDVTGTGSASVDGSNNWTINISTAVGNDSHTHNKLVENSTITYGASYLQWTDLSGTGGTGANGSTPQNPTNDWYHHIIANHSNSGGYYFDISLPFHQDEMFFRRVTNGSQGAFRKIWHDGNFNPSNYLLTTSYVDDYVNAASFNTGTGVLTLTRAEGGTVTVDLDGRYLTSETDSQTLSWNSGNGELSISNGNTVNLDGRYYKPNGTEGNLFASPPDGTAYYAKVASWEHSGAYSHFMGDFKITQRYGISKFNVETSVSNPATAGFACVIRQNNLVNDTLTTNGDVRILADYSGSTTLVELWVKVDGWSGNNYATLEDYHFHSSVGNFVWSGNDASTSSTAPTGVSATYTNSSPFYANESIRAPIFYDLDNTGYYVNPASTSNLNILNVADINRDPTVTLSGDVTGSATMTNLGSINIATTVANDSHTHSNYVLKTGDTMTGALQFNDANTKILEGAGNSLRIQTNSGWTDIGPQNTTWTHIQTDRAGFYTNKKLHVNGDIFVYNTQSQLTSSSVRAPIFYDSDNTAYYVNPASQSVVNTLTVSNIQAPLYTDSDNTSYYVDPNGTSNIWAFNANRFCTIATSAGGHLLTVRKVGAGYADGNACFNAVLDNATGSASWAFHARAGGTAASETFKVRADGYTYLPRLYDINNTAYYLDPASTSVLKTVSMEAAVVTTSMAVAEDVTARRFISEATADTDVGLRLQRASSTGRAQFTLENESGSELWRNGLTGGGSGDFSFYNGTTNVLTLNRGSNYAVAAGSMRAPIFYDSNNTGYYLNAASTSRFNQIDSNYCDVAANNAYAVRFWNGSHDYSIRMSQSTNTTYGGRVSGESTSDYNMYFTMAGGTNRGFVFRNANAATGVIAGIDSSGNARFEGDVVAYSASDKRLKENIKPIDSALDKVSKLGGYEFDWNDKQTVWEDGKHDVGVIAQEVLEVMPEAVKVRSDSYLGVDYEKLVPLLIQAVKELQAEVKSLKEK